MAAENPGFLKDVREYIRAEELLDLSGKEKVLLAVSGGVDSMVMADVLIKSGISVGIAHCNFQLRGEDSENDVQFVEEWANYWNVPFYSEKFDPQSLASREGISLQMAARDLRYEWFEKLRKENGYDLIATAHHLDDLVETVLMNFTKGTGVKGMQGILPMQGKTIRPLLFAPKADLLDYATENKLQWREDESNQSVKYQRNYLRHKVIPALKEVNPSLENTIYENVQHFRDLNQAWEKEHKEKWGSLVQESGGLWYLPIKGLKELKPLRLYLFTFLSPLGFNESQVRQIMDSLDHQPGSLFYARDYQLEIARDHLVIAPYLNKNKTFQIPSELGSFQFEGREFTFEAISISREVDLKESEAVYLDWEKLEQPLVLRHWQEGDSFYPLGMDKPKKLSDFFVDEKVSRLEKERTLILDANGKIAWIVGCRLDERFKITEQTKDLFKIKVRNF